MARKNPAFFQRVGFTLKMGGDLLINSKIGIERIPQKKSKKQSFIAKLFWIWYKEELIK